jgi:hypothetical protein
VVRAVLFIDPESKVRALLYYPLSNGWNFQEIKRLSPGSVICVHRNIDVVTMTADLPNGSFGMDARRKPYFHGIFVGIVSILITTGLHAQSSNPMSTAVIPSDHLVQPEQLNHELQIHPQGVLILQVGSRVLFEEAHIPGAEYAGPASQSEGREILRKRVAKLPRNRGIVIYCGCCPWNRCPNLGPAWNLLAQMGFTHVRALYLANNFGADWVAKGFRAEQSH